LGTRERLLAHLESWKAIIGWWLSLSRLCPANLLPLHGLESLGYHLKNFSQ